MSKNKKFIIIGIAILVLAVGGIMLIMNLTANNSTSNTNNASGPDKQEENPLLGETFTDSQKNVSLRLPKDWQVGDKNTENPGSLATFKHSQSNANGELTATKSNASMDDIVRGYLEGAINVDYQAKLIDNKTIIVGDKSARLLAQEIPGPNNQSARLTQYIFYKGGTYYILTFTMLSSDWETQSSAIEASAASLRLP